MESVRFHPLAELTSLSRPQSLLLLHPTTCSEEHQEANTNRIHCIRSTCVLRVPGHCVSFKELFASSTNLRRITNTTRYPTNWCACEYGLHCLIRALNRRWHSESRSRICVQRIVRSSCGIAHGTRRIGGACSLVGGT